MSTPLHWQTQITPIKIYKMCLKNSVTHLIFLNAFHSFSTHSTYEYIFYTYFRAAFRPVKTLNIYIKYSDRK